MAPVVALLGNVPANQDITTKGVRAGAVVVAITDVTKAVVFGAAMPSATYRVMLQLEGGTAVTLWPTAKTVNGFTVNLSLGVAGTIAYIAVEDG